MRTPARTVAATAGTERHGTVQPMRVLIVEDEPSMANSLRVGLESEGYIVDVSHDGIDGLWRATEFSYDAMVLDLMLPA